MNENERKKKVGKYSLWGAVGVAFSKMLWGGSTSDTVSTLCVFILFFILVVLIIGLVKPSIVVFWSNIKTRKNLLVIFIPISLVTLFSIIGFAPSNESTTIKTSQSSSEDSHKKSEVVKTANTVKSNEQINNESNNKGEEASNISNFKQISVKADYQDTYKDGQQKVVFTVKNNYKDEDFNGDIYVQSVDSRGRTVDSDGLIIDKLPSTVQTQRIVWFKPEGQKFKYEIDGKLTKSMSINSSIDYEIAATQPGDNFITLCIETENNKSSLVSLSKSLKQKYGPDDLTGFQVYFFSKKDDIYAKNKKYSKAFADFFVSYTNGGSELTIYNLPGSINIK